MTQEQRDKLMRYLEAYVDGTLPPAKRAVFEDLLQRSDELRLIVARQKTVDAALKQQFSPPTADRVLGRMLDSRTPAHRAAETQPAADPHITADSHGAGEAQAARNMLFTPLDAKRPAGVASNRPRRLTRAWTVAIAASIALLAGGVWFNWETIRGMIGIQDVAPPGPPPPRTLASIYQNEIDKGFKCQWQCKTEQEFANTFRDKLGEALVMAPTPPSVESLGLSYTTAISAQTVFLLANVDKRPVIVFADRLKKDKPQPPPPPGLHLHRRELGTLVLYELSPFDKPRVVELFKQP